MTPDPDRPGHFIAIVSRKWQDALRGYTDADIESVRQKLCVSAALRPGAVTMLTPAEMKAWLGERLS